MSASAESAAPALCPSRNLARAREAPGVAVLPWNVDTGELTMDQQAYDLWGLEIGLPVHFEDLSAHIHPADRDRVRAAFTATRGVVGPYEIDFRIMVEDEL